MAKVELPFNFTPREYQKPLFRALLEGGKKRAVCVWHRRAGKDKSFLNLLAIQAMTTMANYAYYFPTAALGRKAMWDNIDARSGMKVIDHLPEAIVAKKNEQQMKITLVNGSTIQILGTDNLDVVGGNYYGVIFSESAQQNPLAWDYTRPILRENGGWALFNGTPRGKNWFHRLFTKNVNNPEWFCQLLSIDDTGALTDEDIEEERKSGMREEMIRQEYYCDWSVGLPGAIYAQLVDKARATGRVTNIPLDGSETVWTSWDLGSPRNTSVVYWQFVGGEIHVIDHDSGLDLTPVQRVAHMREKGYSYAWHLFPHDAAATEKSGKNFKEQMAEAGLKNIRIVPRCHEIWAGINKMAEIFPRICFDEIKCEKLLYSLEAYHSKEEKDGIGITNMVVHDWASHDADACRILAEGMLNGMIEGHASIIRKTAPGHHRQTRAKAGSYKG